MKILLSRITPEISRERLKGYKFILIGQLLVAISFLFLYEFFFRHPFQGWRMILTGWIGILMMLMNYLSYELIKDLTENNFIRKLIFSFLWIGVLSGILGATGIFEEGTANYKLLSGFSVSFSLISFVILLYFMFADIFRESHDITYRLWGCASIYLLIGSAFGLFFTLLEIIYPEEFGISTVYDIFHFIPCYNFSFYNLAGIDAPFENFSLLVRNIAVIESIFSNLYIVLVVGRLLSK